MPISIIVARRTATAGELLRRALKEQRSYFILAGCTQTPKELLRQVAEHQPEIAVISSNLEVGQREEQHGTNEIRCS